MIRLAKKVLLKAIGLPLVAVCRKLERGWDWCNGYYALRSISQRGSDCRVHGRITLIGSESVVLGSNVQIGRGCFIVATGGLEIGDHTSISRNVTIQTQTHDYQGEVLPFDHKMIRKPIRIGTCVWIGMNVNILPGVTVGDGAIIGLGTTVSKDVPSRAIVVGAPSRIVAERDADHFQKLLAGQRFKPSRPME